MKDVGRMIKIFEDNYILKNLIFTQILEVSLAPFYGFQTPALILCTYVINVTHGQITKSVGSNTALQINEKNM